MIEGFDPRLNGMPVIRQGDNVFIIQQPTPDIDRMMHHADRMAMMMKQYRCPFSILDEFDKWWRWHELLHFYKKSTGYIMWLMGVDPSQAKQFEIERTMEIRTRSVFGDWTPAVKNFGLTGQSA